MTQNQRQLSRLLKQHERLTDSLRQAHTQLRAQAKIVAEEQGFLAVPHPDQYQHLVQ